MGLEVELNMTSAVANDFIEKCLEGKVGSEDRPRGTATKKHVVISNLLLNTGQLSPARVRHDRDKSGSASAWSCQRIMHDLLEHVLHCYTLVYQTKNVGPAWKIICCNSLDSKELLQ